jgi:hypothetical protein
MQPYGSRSLRNPTRGTRHTVSVVFFRSMIRGYGSGLFRLIRCTRPSATTMIPKLATITNHQLGQLDMMIKQNTKNEIMVQGDPILRRLRLKGSGRDPSRSIKLVDPSDFKRERIRCQVIIGNPLSKTISFPDFVTIAISGGLKCVRPLRKTISATSFHATAPSQPAGEYMSLHVKYSAENASVTGGPPTTGIAFFREERTMKAASGIRSGSFTFASLAFTSNPPRRLRD